MSTEELLSEREMIDGIDKIQACHVRLTEALRAARKTPPIPTGALDAVKVSMRKIIQEEKNVRVGHPEAMAACDRILSRMEQLAAAHPSEVI